MANKLKVAYVLAHKDNTYVRTRVLLASLSKLDFVDLSKCINTLKNPLLYLETPIKLLWLRVTKRPDVYMLGFRGYEVFWLVRLVTIGKPLIFDEFVVLTDWMFNEHKKFKKDSIVGKLISLNYHLMLKSSNRVLSDTEVHSKLSSEQNNIDVNKYTSIYVGTDEKLFKPIKYKQPKDKLKLLFYGKMHPLHGFEYILEAMKSVPENVELTMVGGDKGTEELIDRFKEKNNLGPRIKHILWVNFDDLPKLITEHNLFLGGPFGGTGQATHVITGKTFQALSMGVPTIVGQVIGENDLKDKKNCLMVEQGSAKEIANAINWANDNKDKLPEIAKQARKTYENVYSNQKAADKLGGILKPFL